MRLKTKSAIKGVLRKLNIGITSYARLERLYDRAGDDIEFLLKLDEAKIAPAIRLLKKSQAQFRQDIFALSELNFKRNGYFVDFGALNGVIISNSYLLETEFGWKGIVAEPARTFYDDLKGMRKCHIETRCVWSASGATVSFSEKESADHSTISQFDDSADGKTKQYRVETISLLDLLKKYDAPREIDYLSIDTEGSEYDILSTFDFSQYSFKVITCEHNFLPAREKIYGLLTSKGYVRKFEDVSNVDDWYVRAS